jgi:hypothetical protein
MNFNLETWHDLLVAILKWLIFVGGCFVSIVFLNTAFIGLWVLLCIVMFVGPAPWNEE